MSRDLVPTVHSQRKIGFEYISSNGCLTRFSLCCKGLTTDWFPKTWKFQYRREEKDSFLWRNFNNFSLADQLSSFFPCLFLKYCGKVFHRLNTSKKLQPFKSLKCHRLTIVVAEDKGRQRPDKWCVVTLDGPSPFLLEDGQPKTAKYSTTTVGVEIIYFRCSTTKDSLYF